MKNKSASLEFSFVPRPAARSRAALGTTVVEFAYDYRGRRCTKKVTVAGTVTPAGTLFLGHRKSRSLFRHFIASAILLAVMTP